MFHFKRCLIFGIFVVISRCTSNANNESCSQHKLYDQNTCSNQDSPAFPNSVKVINDIADVTKLTDEQFKYLHEEILKHGAVVVKNQMLTKTQHEEVTETFGEIVILPPSFEGKEMDPQHPGIAFVSNYFFNGTWKGRKHSFGQYWHKDGNYNTFEKGYQYSFLYAVDYNPNINGGGTAFINGCEVARKLPKELKQKLQGFKVKLGARLIPDFQGGLEEDFALYPEFVEHDLLFKHPEKNEECLFMANIVLDDPDAKRKEILHEVWEFLQEERFIFQHSWTTGDLLIWDNYGVFHRALPIDDVGYKRSLRRTMALRQLSN